MATTQALAPIPELALAPGMKLVFEALDPTTSLAVAGVTVERVSIAGDVTGDAVVEIGMHNLMAPATPAGGSSSSGGAPARASTAPPGARAPR